MAELYRQIDALCTAQGITVGKMCADTGISRGNMSDLKMGRIKSLSSEALNRVARYFDVSLDFLLTGSAYGVTLADVWPPQVQAAWDGAPGDDARRQILLAHGVTAAQLHMLPALFAPPAEGDIGMDDFTYALWQETRELTEEQKQALLGMARYFKSEQDKQAPKKETDAE